MIIANFLFEINCVFVFWNSFDFVKMENNIYKFYMGDFGVSISNTKCWIE
jgi:hypothetical protein